MTCLHPTVAYICGTIVAKDGVVSPRIVFSHSEALEYFTKLGCPHMLERNMVSVPCGHCINCQMRKRKDMSVRLAHEASCFEQCCFITLTYNERNVPTTDWNELKCHSKQFDRGAGSLPEYTLCPSDVQKFMKRLRAHLEYHYGIKGLRYFAVGEYGGKTHRPHYHIILFGWKPNDLEFLKFHNGNPVYTSQLLQKKWKMGFSSVSDVSPFVAKYAARYVTKKYARLSRGDDNYLVPEFTLQSTRNGGIGATWFDRFGCQACRVGFCTLRCSDTRISKHSIPRYYFDRLRKRNLPLWLELRDERIEFMKTSKDPVSFENLCNIAACAAEQIKHEIDKEFF